MRKGDLELLESRFGPVYATQDRLTKDVSECLRLVKASVDRLKDLERDRESNGLKIDQSLASVRSMLQRANRVARVAAEAEEEEEVAESVPEVKIPRTADQIIADARARNAGRTIL